MSVIAQEYVTAAIDHGRHTREGNSRAGNRAHDRVVRAVKEFRKLSDRGECILLGLTEHADKSVKVWAATHLLPLREDAASPVLESVASGSGLIALGALMVLREWRARRLKID